MVAGAKAGEIALVSSNTESFESGRADTDLRPHISSCLARLLTAATTHRAFNVRALATDFVSDAGTKRQLNRNSVLDQKFCKQGGKWTARVHRVAAHLIIYKHFDHVA